MSDYDYDPKEKPSDYLRLKKKDDKITIRLSSAPFREVTVWAENAKAPMDDDKISLLSQRDWIAIYQNPELTVNEAFTWTVIDRADGRAKIFTGTPGIYKSIKEYAVMPAWGDPQGYDLQIERTEEPGRSYYKVTPLPNKDTLTQRDLKLVSELKFEEKKPNARALNQRQVDYIPDVPQEFDRDIEGDASRAAAERAEIKRKIGDMPAASTPPDVVIEDFGGDPINLDDIPFN